MQRDVLERSVESLSPVRHGWHTCFVSEEIRSSYGLLGHDRLPRAATVMMFLPAFRNLAGSEDAFEDTATTVLPTGFC